MNCNHTIDVIRGGLSWTVVLIGPRQPANAQVVDKWTFFSGAHLAPTSGTDKH